MFVEPSLDDNKTGIQGWINLDGHGNLLGDELKDCAGTKSHKAPSAKLVFVDGRCAHSLVAELSVPRVFSDNATFNYFRNTLCWTITVHFLVL